MRDKGIQQICRARRRASGRAAGAAAHPLSSPLIPTIANAREESKLTPYHREQLREARAFIEMVLAVDTAPRLVAVWNGKRRDPITPDEAAWLKSTTPWHLLYDASTRELRVRREVASTDVPNLLGSSPPEPHVLKLLQLLAERPNFILHHDLLCSTAGSLRKSIAKLRSYLGEFRNFIRTVEIADASIAPTTGYQIDPGINCVVICYGRSKLEGSP